MNDIIATLRSLVVAVLIAVTAAPALAAPSQRTTVTLDERAAIGRAVARNPTLAAAVVESQRADLLVTAEEHRYPFTLSVDASGSRDSTPALGTAGVVYPESTGLTGVATLDRRLAWGTDLYLRLGSSRSRTESLALGAVADQPPLVTTGPAYAASLRLGITQPLLSGAGRAVHLAPLLSATGARTRTLKTEEQTASQILLDVSTAYWELAYAEQQQRIEERSLDLALGLAADAEARVRTGSLAPIEQLSFESRVASLRESVATATEEARRRAIDLAKTMGDTDVLPIAREGTGGASHAPGLSPGDAATLALAASPEVASMRASLELAVIEARTATDALRARLDVSAWVETAGLGDRNVGDALSGTARLRAVSGFVGLTFQAPLDDTRRRTEQRRADLAVEAARQHLAETTTRIRADLDATFSKLNAAGERTRLAERTVEITRRQQEAEAARFRTGSATTLQVRQAEDDVRAAESRLARAQVDVTIAGLGIKHLCGQLLREWATPEAR